MRQSIKRILSVVALVFVLVFASSDAYSQCAMCRATVESNAGTGSDASDNEVGTGLNMGILYLMVVPYLLIGTVGFLWYKNNRKNANKA
ncbi:hypothetical protein [Pontibacter litorisediminis]|uniref:hypothetical protein n=1 Tax=Pontibacter litorisediminis TaxID=1846260 RepID=UPI0023ED9AB5|nr:hypothetical protein [Pontibacter litorisediminis]